MWAIVVAVVRLASLCALAWKICFRFLECHTTELGKQGQEQEHPEQEEH